jgi:hypothetical protein
MPQLHYLRVSNDREKIPAVPMINITMPPTINPIARSVGASVSNREISELNEFNSLLPNMMSASPPTSSANEIALYIFFFLLTN